MPNAEVPPSEEELSEEEVARRLGAAVEEAALQVNPGAEEEARRANPVQAAALSSPTEATIAALWAQIEQGGLEQPPQ